MTLVQEESPKIGPGQMEAVCSQYMLHLEYITHQQIWTDDNSVVVYAVQLVNSIVLFLHCHLRLIFIYVFNLHLVSSNWVIFCPVLAVWAEPEQFLWCSDRFDAVYVGWYSDWDVDVSWSTGDLLAGRHCLTSVNLLLNTIMILVYGSCKNMYSALIVGWNIQIPAQKQSFPPPLESSSTGDAQDDLL